MESDEMAPGSDVSALSASDSRPSLSTVDSSFNSSTCGQHVLRGLGLVYDISVCSWRPLRRRDAHLLIGTPCLQRRARVVFDGPGHPNIHETLLKVAASRGARKNLLQRSA